jgi:hypothetical protein
MSQEYMSTTPADESRTALAYITGAPEKLFDASVDSTLWLWEAIQGDFNQDRSTGQIAFDAAISMVPLVDQICDIRDLIANCREIQKDQSNTWAWVSIGLTLIGMFPVLGSLVKGVLKIFFLFIRRSGGNAVAKAVDEAMTWVITLLRKQEVMKYWRKLRWGNVFEELANSVKKVRDQVQLGPLLQAFDNSIALLTDLLGNLQYVPLVKAKAQETLEMLNAVRLLANSHLEKAVKPIQDALDVIIRRLEMENLVQHRAVLNTMNVHFRGGLPEAQAVSLMRKAEPPPAWLSKGKPGEFLPLKPDDVIPVVNTRIAQGYPKIDDDQIKSFALGMKAVELIGPQRLYRVVSPSGVASANDWVTEAVFNQIKESTDPKAAWRKHLAVWPDWNVNGQFVIYELKAGETLKVWKGPAAAQVKPKAAELGDRFLEGGWEQVKFDSSQVRNASGESIGKAFDTMTYYRVDRKTGRMELDPAMNRPIYNALSPEEKVHYECLRDKINHPVISGPFDTRWGMTDFDAQLNNVRLGLPALPGQLTELKK